MFDMGSRWTFLIILIPIFIILLHLVGTLIVSKIKFKQEDSSAIIYMKLFLGALLWSILIMIPIMAILFLNTANLWHTGIFVYLGIGANAFIFGLVNKFRVINGVANIVECQITHFIQIAVTWLITVILFLS